jgi:hypothetical protein
VLRQDFRPSRHARLVEFRAPVSYLL